MNLRNIKKYQDFNYEEFLKGKKLLLNEIKFDVKNKLVKGELIIIEDITGENQYGKINFKLENGKEEDVTKYQLRQLYRLNGITKASIYGDFGDNLSIVCKGLVKDEANYKASA